MNRLITSLMLGLVGMSSPLYAQNAGLFTTSETLDAGNIVAPHLVHGDMWWNPAAGTYTMQFPKGVSGQLEGLSAIWMGGMNTSSILRVASQDYRQRGTDMWPGPISGQPASDSSAITKAWARIWKINSSTIDAFLTTPSHTIANTPPEILEWPGKGNVYAKGANNTTLNIPDNMAPFVDINANGVYDPLAGDYPKMKGSQMLWWVLNDYALHTVSNSLPLGVEIHVSAYAYANGTIADNILFYEYDLTNHSTSHLSDFVFASMCDLDIAYAFNNYAGYDSSKRLAVIYGKDGSGKPSRGAAGGYVLLDQPGDHQSRYSPAGAMTYYLNEAPSPNSNPENGLEQYRLMTGSNRVGNQIRPGSNYAFGSLNESCTDGTRVNDQRFVLSTSPVAFAPQQTLHIAYGFVAADSLGTCATNINFDRLLETADSAYKLYWNPSRHSPTAIEEADKLHISLFPNPAENMLFLRGDLAPQSSIQVTNTLGATVAVSVTRNAAGLNINTSNLAPGCYHIRVLSGKETVSRSFIKQ